MTNCLFCEKYKNKNPEIIGENKFFYYHLDLFPVTPGHMEIIPKKHIDSLMDLTNNEWTYLKSGINDAINLIENKINLKDFYSKLLKNPVNEKSKSFLEDAINSPFINQKPDSYNHGNNDGKAAGRTIHHLHWHIIPRYYGDVKNPEGGIRHIIPKKGNYK